MVDGGGVCRDKYLPVNTERLALPSRSASLCAPQTTCIAAEGAFDGRREEEESAARGRGKRTSHKRARLRDKA